MKWKCVASDDDYNLVVGSQNQIIELNVAICWNRYRLHRKIDEVDNERCQLSH